MHTPPWVPLTLQARTIDNAEEIKEIMAGAIEQAEGGKGAKAVHRASVRLDRALTVEALARGFRLVVDEPESFGGANAGRIRRRW